jgi:hypothetical protein
MKIPICRPQSVPLPVRHRMFTSLATKARHLTAFLLAMAVASTLSAQANNNGGKGSLPGNGNDQGGNRASDDWAALKALAKSGSVPKRGERSSRADAATEHGRQIAAARSTAEAAHAFYMRYPADARAAEARKLEAIFALRGVAAGDQTQELAAVATATAYRVDRALPTKDRLDVAITMESQALALKVRTGLISERGEEQKKIIKGLRAEFGSLPELDSYAVAIARRSDPRTAHALASEVLSSSAATIGDLREAKATKERAKLLGQLVKLSVPLADGGELDLGAERGHVTIVVVWSPRRPEALDTLGVFGRAFPRGTQVVALALGGTEKDAKRIGSILPVVTKSAYAPLGPTTNSAVDALKVHLSPYVYVLNRSGLLTDFGTIEDLPDVLTRAGVTQKRTS